MLLENFSVSGEPIINFSTINARAIIAIANLIQTFIFIYNQSFYLPKKT